MIKRRGSDGLVYRLSAKIYRISMETCHTTADGNEFVFGEEYMARYAYEDPPLEKASKRKKLWGLRLNGMWYVFDRDLATKL